MKLSEVKRVGKKHYLHFKTEVSDTETTATAND